MNRRLWLGLGCVALASPAQAEFVRLPCTPTLKEVRIGGADPTKVPLNSRILLVLQPDCMPAQQGSVLVRLAGPDGMPLSLTEQALVAESTLGHPGLLPFTVDAPGLQPHTRYTGDAEEAETGARLDFTLQTGQDRLAAPLEPPGLAVEQLRCQLDPLPPTPAVSPTYTCTWKAVLTAPVGSAHGRGIFHVDGLVSGVSTVSVLKEAPASQDVEFSRVVTPTGRRRCFSLSYQDEAGQQSPRSAEVCPQAVDDAAPASGCDAAPTTLAAGFWAWAAVFLGRRARSLDTRRPG